MALEHIQDPDDDEQSWKALVDAIEQAVTYHANGISKREAFGLSIWYPLSFKEKDLDAYAKASPLTSYVAALEHAYKTRMDPVEFSDPGSINDAGRFSITISPESKEEFFDLYIENSGVDGSYADTNGDMKGSWEILSFSYPPEEAVAITLNGMVLDAELISYDESYELFSCPVVIDDEDMYLRILWTWNYEEPGNGHYDLVGVWNGVDHTSGMAGRSDIELVPGSIVEARKLSDDSIRGQVKIGDTIEISEQPLPPGTYKSRFVAMDLRGNEYPSSTYTYKIDEQGNTQNISIG
jgi:hypothetical protein